MDKLERRGRRTCCLGAQPGEVEHLGPGGTVIGRRSGRWPRGAWCHTAVPSPGARAWPSPETSLCVWKTPQAETRCHQHTCLEGFSTEHSAGCSRSARQTRMRSDSRNPAGVPGAALVNRQASCPVVPLWLPREACTGQRAGPACGLREPRGVLGTVDLPDPPSRSHALLGTISNWGMKASVAVALPFSHRQGLWGGGLAAD